MPIEMNEHSHRPPPAGARLRPIGAGLDRSSVGRIAVSSSCAGLTRASIPFRKQMDCRVKPGNDRWLQPNRKRFTLALDLLFHNADGLFDKGIPAVRGNFIHKAELPFRGQCKRAGTKPSLRAWSEAEGEAIQRLRAGDRL